MKGPDSNRKQVRSAYIQAACISPSLASCAISTPRLLQCCAQILVSTCSGALHKLQVSVDGSRSNFRI